MADFFLHPTVCVDQPVSIGANTKIWHFCHIARGATIGANCTLGQNVYVGGRAVIGRNCKIQNNVSIYDLVTLEDDVFCGPAAAFTNDLNPRAAFPKDGRWVPTLVRRGASLGANCTIICGITIGSNAFVAAGALVRRDVPDHAIVAGNPARLIGWMCRCGGRLDFHGTRDARCPSCRSRYRKAKNRVERTA